MKKNESKQKMMNIFAMADEVREIFLSHESYSFFDQDLRAQERFSKTSEALKTICSEAEKYFGNDFLMAVYRDEKPSIKIRPSVPNLKSVE